MVGSGVIATGTFKLPGEAIVNGIVQSELTENAQSVLSTGETTGKNFPSGAFNVIKLATERRQQKSCKHGQCEYILPVGY
jgi:hypothetical protein